METSQSPESVKRLFVHHSTRVSAAHFQCLAHTHTFTCTHTHTQCTETTRRHRVRVHTHTSLSVPAFFSRLNLYFSQVSPLQPLPFPTSLSGVCARRHVHAPTSADSSAGCGECAAPRGPYLSYATLCKSAAITEQQEQR